MKKFLVIGAAFAALTVAGCMHGHHKAPVVAKGFAPVASAPVLGVAPAANWK